MSKQEKGKRGGNCNRERCQKPGAWWYNRGSLAWYCEDCAWILNGANPKPFADGKLMVIYVPESLSEEQVTKATKFVSWKGVDDK